MRKIVLLLALFPLGVIAQKFNYEHLQKLLDAGDFENCLAQASASLKTDSTNCRMYFYKAFSEKELRMFSKSIESSTRGLHCTAKDNSDYTLFLSTRSFAYGFSGQIDLAIKDAEEIVRISPNEINYLLNLSYFYGENQDYSRCLNTLKNALKIDSSNIFVLSNLAYYSCELGDFQAASVYAVKGLSISKDSVWTGGLLNSLGFAQSKTISVERGVETIKKAISFNSNTPYTYFNLGRIYMSKGETNLACDNFIKAKQLGGVNMTAEYLDKLRCEK
jgi:tetratricopeptide (TPR) repeat protein